MIHALSVPIVDWSIPPSCGIIGYEGDINASRLTFTGAEEGYDYKLDFQRAGCREKRAVDLQREGSTLYVDFDENVDIPTGTYHIQLRTVGPTVVHTNKSTLVVKSSINALKDFRRINLTEAAQIEARLTALKGDVQTATAQAQDHAHAAAQALAGCETAADQATAAQKAALSAQDQAQSAQSAAEQAAGQAQIQAQEAQAQAKEAAAQAQKAADYTNAYSKSEMDALLSQCVVLPYITQSARLWHREGGGAGEARNVQLTGGCSQMNPAIPGSKQTIYCLEKGSNIRIVGKNLFDPATPPLRSIPAANTVAQDGGTIRITVGAAESWTTLVIPAFRMNQCAGKTLSLSYVMSKSDTITNAHVELVRCDDQGTSASVISDENGIAVIPETGHPAQLESTHIDQSGWVGIQVSLDKDTTTAVGDTVTLRDIQIELGKTATAYEPYKLHSTVTVPCDLRRCGEYADAWNPGTGEVVRRVGLWIGDGTNYKFTSYNANYRRQLSAMISGCKVLSDTDTGALCSNFRYDDSARSIYGTDVGFCLYGGRVYCRLDTQLSSAITSISTANTWLSQKKMTVTYPLDAEIREHYDPQNIDLPGGISTLLFDGHGQPGVVTLSHQSDLESYIKAVVGGQLDTLETRVAALETQVNQLETA